jgi:hypothetical protein
VFKAIEESFDDAAYMMEPLVEEEMKEEKDGAEEKEAGDSEEEDKPR